MRISESKSSVDAVADVFKALADPTRVRIIALLLELGELCVCDVEVSLAISQSKASRHLGTLKAAGLLSDRRDGAWVYYRIADRSDVAGALGDLKNALVGDVTIAADRDRAASTARGCES